MIFQTLSDLLIHVTQLMANAAFDNPSIEAKWLLCDSLGLTLSQLHLRGDRPLCDRQVKKTLYYAARRSLNEPLSHIHGELAFQDLLLFSDQRALIPRPETEQLAQIAKDHRQTPPKAILDLGTGSGCLALFLKKSFPNAFVVGSDISQSALDLAESNAQRNDVVVEWKCGDWWAPHQGERFDLIVSNPPYVSEKAYQQLDPQIRDFEPRGAFVAGPTGMEALISIAAQLRRHLNPGGSFFAEIGFDQAPRALALFAKRQFSARVIPDLWGKQRFLLIE